MPHANDKLGIMVQALVQDRGTGAKGHEPLASVSAVTRGSTEFGKCTETIGTTYKGTAGSLCRRPVNQPVLGLNQVDGLYDRVGYDLAVDGSQPPILLLISVRYS
ncbi:hypothetical protein NKDENANG_02549 [Candidatus Entotheonellaceae bacterium PAL068K]